MTKMFILRNILRYILIILCLFLLLHCRREIPKELVLFDFENDSELNQLQWKCHTLYSQSNEYPAHGLKSLKLELYPSDYPGLNAEFKENDWRGYKEFSVNIYNPLQNSVKIFVRIDDRTEHVDYKHRYNKDFILNPGINRIIIPLNSLIASGNAVPLNLKEIERLIIFMVRPEERAVLYVDYMRLST